jgi:hypothetical protein
MEELTFMYNKEKKIEKLVKKKKKWDGKCVLDLSGRRSKQLEPR